MDKKRCHPQKRERTAKDYSVNVSIAICIPSLKAYSKMAASPSTHILTPTIVKFLKDVFLLIGEAFFNSS